MKKFSVKVIITYIERWCLMKVLLFSEGKKMFSKSGVGRALKHQMEALTFAL